MEIGPQLIGRNEFTKLKKQLTPKLKLLLKRDRLLINYKFKQKIAPCEEVTNEQYYESATLELRIINVPKIINIQFEKSSSDFRVAEDSAIWLSISHSPQEYYSLLKDICNELSEAMRALTITRYSSQIDSDDLPQPILQRLRQAKQNAGLLRGIFSEVLALKFLQKMVNENLIDDARAATEYEDHQEKTDCFFSYGSREIRLQIKAGDFMHFRKDFLHYEIYYIKLNGQTSYEEFSGAILTIIERTNIAK